MSLFGQLVRTTVNVVMLPVAVVKDVVTLGSVGRERGSYTTEALKELKEEAEDDD